MFFRLQDDQLIADRLIGQNSPATAFYFIGRGAKVGFKSSKGTKVAHQSLRQRAFGFAEVLSVMRNPPAEMASNPQDSVIPKISDILKYWRTIIRSGLIGTVIGIIPGVGEDIGAWVSYAAARLGTTAKVVMPRTANQSNTSVIASLSASRPLGPSPPAGR